MNETLISSRALNDLLSEPGIVIVDCRFDLTDPAAGRRRYLEGHIPGAVYADLETDLCGPVGPDTGRHPLPEAERIQEVFSRLGIDNHMQVVAYDDMSGAFAARLWWMLRYMGHDASVVLDGGWQDWLAHGFAVEEGDIRPRPGEFRGAPRPDWLLEIVEIASLSCLVDCRDPVRYRGENEPVDPVAGHIPGAVNYFWQRNLDETGRFRDPADLRRDLLSVLGDTPPEEAGFYCGSGVTACHNLLAAVHAGLGMPRLYAGSWSQWCADPDRPVATGE